MKIIYALLLASFSLSANANLISIDLFSVGDNLVTKDTKTGLEWLDLTETQNLSPRQILEGAGGWSANGFVYATTSQVTQLFLNSNNKATLTPPGEDVTEENLKGALNLLDLLGTTYVQNCCNNFSIVGNGFAGINEPGLDLIYGAAFGTNLNSTAGFFSIQAGTFSTEFSDPFLGSYLVRSVSAVPLPAAAPLFLSALGFMGFSAKFRKKKS